MGLTRLYLAQRGLCFHCLEPMLWASERSKNKRRHTKEHVIPRSKGGGMGTNIVLAHFSCNVARGNQPATPEMTSRAKAIWARAVRFPAAEVERFSRDRTVVGTYAIGYEWPAPDYQPNYDQTGLKLQ